MTANSGYGVISPINLSIPAQPVDMAPEDQKKFTGVYTSVHSLVAALRDYAGIGNWSKSHLASLKVGDTSYAGLTNRIFVEAGENIETNDIVEINSLGKAVKSMSSNVCGMMIGKDTTTGNLCEVMMFFGIVKNFSGLTPGSTYFVGGIPGKLATSGTFPVGRAVSPNAMFINIRL